MPISVTTPICMCRTRRVKRCSPCNPCRQPWSGSAPAPGRASRPIADQAWLPSLGSGVHALEEQGGDASDLVGMRVHVWRLLIDQPQQLKVRIVIEQEGGGLDVEVAAQLAGLLQVPEQATAFRAQRIVHGTVAFGQFIVATKQ